MAATTEEIGRAPRRVPSALTKLQGIDLRSTWQLAVGSVLVPLGIVIILIAWYGSAHTPYVQQQIPYLVSGSFIGLGMMLVGALLYWAHWLYRMYDQADLHHQAAMARQEELFERLVQAIGTVDRPQHVAADNGALPEEVLVATATGSNVHRPDCPIVARHPAGLRRLTWSTAGDRAPCRICQPAR